MLERKDHILIDHYIQGVLSFEEKENVEKRLMDEDDLNHYYEQQILLIKGIERAGSSETADFLKTLESSLPPVEFNRNDETEHPTQANSQKAFKWLFAAASVTVIFIVTFLLFSGNPSSERLFADHFEPYPNIISANVRTGTTLTRDGLYYYDLGNYEKAIQLLKEELDKGKAGSDNISEKKFYLANAYLANGETDHAINALKSINEKSTVFKEQKSWYLSLAYLKKEEWDKAKKELELLQQLKGESIYKEKAEKLLNSIY